jgi:uncharacterized protein YbjT (DUF2867 family)
VSAFVLGSTGHVGREVVRQLCVRGAKAIAHVRPDSARLGEWTERFTAMGASVDASPWKVAELAARLRELAPAQIYILVGTRRARAKQEAIQGDIYEAIDLGLTQLAVDAAKQAGITTRLVYLSSVGASTKASSAYLRARGKAEDIVMTSGLPWVIARPSMIVGERDEHRRTEDTAAAVGDGLLAVVSLFGGKKLRAKYRSTNADILASALIRIAEAPEHDRVFDGNDLR